MSVTDKFIAEVEPLLTAGDLTSLLVDWERRLSCLKNIATMFNRYDFDNVQSLFDKNPRSGQGWTAHFLEHSRRNRTNGFVSTGHRDADFCVVAQELDLSISAKNNLVGPEVDGELVLDALGLRRDGTFCVIEVKGPSDSGSIKHAILQALCGAIGLYVKREDMTKIARLAVGRRPAFRNAFVPVNERSISIYVIAATDEFEGRPTSIASGYGIDLAAARLVEAWSPLREIIVFEVHSMTPILDATLSATKRWRPAEQRLL